jgi:uncharacterized repeat protein (TIGR03803 family)
MKKLLFILLATLALAGQLARGQTAGPVLQTLFQFNDTNGNDVGFGLEVGSCILGPDGFFYGTTLFSESYKYYSSGASSGGIGGSVFKISTNGTITDLHDFSVNTDNNSYFELRNFTNYDGADCYYISVGTDGDLYGNCIYGGLDSHGTIFRVITTTGQFEVLNSAADLLNMEIGSDGNYYGFSFTPPYPSDTFFSQVDLSGAITPIIDVTGLGISVSPIEPWLTGPDGNFYGQVLYDNNWELVQMTKAGQLNILTNLIGSEIPLVVGPGNEIYCFNGGTFFKFNTNGVFTTITTNFPTALISATLLPDGNFYGCNYEAPWGAIYQITTNGVATRIYALNGKDEGINPFYLSMGPDGNVYGATAGDGVLEYGSFFRLLLNMASWQTTITPAAVGPLGASWSLDGTNWWSSGTTLTNLARGQYTVQYSPVAGWNTPANQTVNISNFWQSVSVVGNYTSQGGGGGSVGNLKVTLLPASIDNLAQWQVDGGVWKKSGVTVTNLSTGLHLVSFSSVSNWTASASLQVTIAKGKTTITNAVYRPVTNVLQIQISGLGTVTPNDNNKWLQTGNQYSVTAKPANGFAFANWSGGIGEPLNVLTNKEKLGFTMQSNLVLQANFYETAKPIVTIIKPKQNAKIPANYTMTGTAKDDWGVANVWYAVNQGGWISTTSSNGYKAWTAVMSLPLGTNHVQVIAENLGGLYSTNHNLRLIVTN